LNPIPAKDTEKVVVDAGRTAGDATRHEHLMVEGEKLVVLCFAGTRELLPKDAIAEGSWICGS